MGASVGSQDGRGLPRETKGDPFLTMGKLEGGDGGSCPGRRELAVASKMCPGQFASVTKCILGNVAGTRKALILIKLKSARTIQELNSLTDPQDTEEKWTEAFFLKKRKDLYMKN